MTPKRATAATKKPERRLVILKTDCMNFEGDYSTMEEALEKIQEMLDCGEWDTEDLEYVRILEVTTAHIVRPSGIVAEPTDLIDI